MLAIARAKETCPLFSRLRSTDAISTTIARTRRRPAGRIVHRVRDYAELAELAMASRARISQIMNLNLLCPKLQEALLFLPAVQEGGDVVTFRSLQAVCLECDWEKQRTSKV